MTIFTYCVIYASLLVFIVACLVRTLRYARAPIHLRWELYPVPHEEPGRVKHGGSYFEATDWWTKPPHYNLWGELRVMIPEMILLRGLWEFNRKLWYRSFPFHFGLYLLAATAAAIFLRAGIFSISPDFSLGALGRALHHFYTCTGVVGAALVLIGAAGLLFCRLTDENLKTYTTRGDIFNLLLFISTVGLFAVLFLSHMLIVPGPFNLARAILTFDMNLKIPGPLAASMIAGSFLVAYIPLTHMYHFIAKWFTYHSVRWDDAPSARQRNSRLRIAECLTYRPTWSAAHVRASVAKTWAEVAAADPTKGARK